MENIQTIHIYDKNNQYLGKMRYSNTSPIFTEDTLVDIITILHPELKNKRWFFKS